MKAGAETDHTTGEMTGNRSKTVVAALLLAVAAVSCDRNVYYSENYSLEDGEWSMYDPARYTCPAEDTVSIYNIEFSLRTSTEYPYRNIYLFVLTTFPSGTTITDTLHAMVTDEKGRWLGKGTGDIRELTIPFKNDVYFPETGDYHFRVVHGMRDTVLKGVYDMGMRISRQQGTKK